MICEVRENIGGHVRRNFHDFAVIVSGAARGLDVGIRNMPVLFEHRLHEFQTRVEFGVGRFGPTRRLELILADPKLQTCSRVGGQSIMALVVLRHGQAYALAQLTRQLSLIQAGE